MLNYLIPVLALIISLTTKPYYGQSNSASTNSVQTAPKLETLSKKVEFTQVNTKSEVENEKEGQNKEINISNPNTPTPTPIPLVKLNENKADEILTTITPTPFATPSIQIVRPPDDDVKFEPTPTKKPSCFCDPDKEMLCIDRYDC